MVAPHYRAIMTPHRTGVKPASKVPVPCSAAQKDAGLHARLIQRLWFDQADMMPYRRRILAERRRQFLHG